MRKEIFREGVYAGALLAISFWLAELLFCVFLGLRDRQFLLVDFGEIARALPVYLLFCAGFGVVSALLQDVALLSTALLIGGVGLFGWASRVEENFRVFRGTPLLHFETWLLGLLFLAPFWWAFLQEKTTQEIKRNNVAAFWVFPLWLLGVQHLCVWFQYPYLVGKMLLPVEKYGAFLGTVLIALFGFFLVKKWIAPFIVGKPARFLLSFCLLVSLGAYSPQWLPVQSSQKPNIVLVVLDTVRVDRLSCYGYSKRTSPHFDQLAKEGLLFEQAKATSHWTLPSHASLFTGLFPSHHGANWETFHLQEKYRTVAEHLRAQGYRTVGFSANDMVGYVTGLHQGFYPMVDLWRNDQRSFLARLETKMKGIAPMSAPALNALFRRWLPYEHRRPLFLFVNYIEAHHPYEVHEGVSESFWSEPGAKEDIQTLNQNTLLYYAGRLKYTPKDFQLLSDLYDGEIAYLDSFFGELMETLRREGVLDNGILVVTSDHGEYFGEHRLIANMGGLYEEALHIPLLIYSPKEPLKGRIKETVQLTDIPPTLLDLAHLHPLEGIDGRSLAPLMKGGKWSPSPVIAEQSRLTEWLKWQKRGSPSLNFSSLDYSSYSFQEGAYKAILSSNRPPELYDLETDRKESHNLYETFKEHPIFGHLTAYLAGGKERRMTSSSSPMRDAEKLRVLKSMGYL